MRKLTWLLLCCCCCMALVATAAETRLADKQEARLKTLSRNLRCLVCQNESLAESHAPLAGDLREEIRDQIRTGASDDAIIDYLVARYGDFVTYHPPFNTRTYLLWLGPVAVLLLLLASLWRYVRRHRPAAQVVDAQEVGKVQEEVRRLTQQYGENND